MKVEVAVLGSPSVRRPVVSVDVKQHLKKNWLWNDLAGVYISRITPATQPKSISRSRWNPAAVCLPVFLILSSGDLSAFE